MSHKSFIKESALLSREYYLEKPKVEAEIKVALGYPNSYKLGMANLGFQAVYRLFNSLEGVVCQRFFLPNPLQQKQLQRRKKVLTALESGKALKEFDLLAFSLSYEMDYPNAMRILNLAGIPFLAEDRDENWPLIIFGGACTFINPEPLAPLADIMVIGEGEELIPQLIELMREGQGRKSLLRKLSHLPGFYIPSLYKIHYKAEGTIEKVEALEGAQLPVQRVWVKEITEEQISYSTMITSETAFGKLFLVELCRGCTAGCRFCWAGFNYLPRRCNQPETIVQLAKAARKYTKRIGLIATSVGNYTGLKDIIKELLNLDYSVTLSSLRIDHINEELLHFLVKGGLRSIAIAPETGNERLRCTINKRITNEEILHKVELIFSSGIYTLKLYYLIGLPTETEEDLKAIVNLTDQIRKLMIQIGRPRGRVGKLNLSINCFIPKPHTPFQWLPLEEFKVLRPKVSFLRKSLSALSNVKVSLMSPAQAQRQALLSRGDRSIAQLLIFMEQHKYGWAEALRRSNIDADFHIRRTINLREYLPWDVIDNHIKKANLWASLQRALRDKIDEKRK